MHGRRDKPRWNQLLFQTWAQARLCSSCITDCKLSLSFSLSFCLSLSLALSVPACQPSCLHACLSVSPPPLPPPPPPPSIPVSLSLSLPTHLSPWMRRRCSETYPLSRIPFSGVTNTSVYLHCDPGGMTVRTHNQCRSHYASNTY